MYEKVAIICSAIKSITKTYYALQTMTKKYNKTRFVQQRHTKIGEVGAKRDTCLATFY